MRVSKLPLHILYVLYIFTSCLVALFITAPTIAAGTADVILNFDKATYALNEQVELSIVVNSGSQSVMVGSLDLQYDAERLQLLRIENNSTVFRGEVSAVGGNGSMNITKYVVPIGSSSSGLNLFSTAVFRTLNPGEAKVTIADSSLLFSENGSDSVWNGQANEKSIVVLQAEANNIFTAQSNNPIPETVSRFASNPSQPAEEEQADFPDRAIPIDTTTITVEKSFVSVRVLNKESDVIVGARVTLDGVEAETDLVGIASFGSIPFGIYSLTITTPDGDTVNTNIEVLESSNPLEVQEFEFVVGATEDDSSPVAIFIVSVVAVVLATVGLVIYQKRKSTIYPL